MRARKASTRSSSRRMPTRPAVLFHLVIGRAERAHFACLAIFAGGRVDVNRTVAFGLTRANLHQPFRHRADDFVGRFVPLEFARCEARVDPLAGLVPGHLAPRADERDALIGGHDDRLAVRVIAVGNDLAPQTRESLETGLPRRPTWPVSRPAVYTLTQSSDAIGEGSIGFGQATRAQRRDRKGVCGSRWNPRLERGGGEQQCRAGTTRRDHWSQPSGGDSVASNSQVPPPAGHGGSLSPLDRYLS